MLYEVITHAADRDKRQKNYFPATLAHYCIIGNKNHLMHELENRSKADIGQSRYDTNEGCNKNHTGVFTGKKEFPCFHLVHFFIGTVQP